MPTATAPRPVYWTGKPPAKDDFGDPIRDQFIDGKTRQGPWGYLTPANHAKYGVGLGTGLGQRYAKQADGRWLKVEG